MDTDATDVLAVVLGVVFVGLGLPAVLTVGRRARYFGGEVAAIAAVAAVGTLGAGGAILYGTTRARAGGAGTDLPVP